MAQGCVTSYGAGGGRDVKIFDMGVAILDLKLGRPRDRIVKMFDTDGAPLRHFYIPYILSRIYIPRRVRSLLPETPTKGNWVQTERAAHEAWATLIEKAPKAAQLMHILTARIGDHNAVVVSQKTLASLMRCSRRTVQRAVEVLVEDRWIEIRQIGENGTVNAHIINDRVAWTGKRDGIRYSLFTAAVVIADKEQPDSDHLGQQAPLRRLPSLFRSEQQLPNGDGLPPPSQPFLEGMEPDLPAIDRAKFSTIGHEE